MARRYAFCIIEHLRKLFGNPMVGAEIGVGDGGTTVPLLRAFPEMQLYAVDPWEIGDPENTTASLVTTDRLRLLRETFLVNIRGLTDRVVVLPMMSVDACERVKDGELDFAFIDGDHRYQAVHDDLWAWWPKLRNGGIMICHDYRARRYYGVIQAVTEFCLEHNLTIEMLDPTMCMLRKA